MSTVADQLRQGREAKKLTVHQVADITKIRTDHIRALEAGNYSVFSAPVYIRGFVRNYATLLKLDVPQIMAALDEELGRTEKFSEPPPLTNQKRGPLDFIMLQFSKLDLRKSLIVLAVLVAVGGVIIASSAWRRSRSRDPLSEIKPGMYQPTNRNAGQTLPLPAPSPRR